MLHLFTIGNYEAGRDKEKMQNVNLKMLNIKIFLRGKETVENMKTLVHYYLQELSNDRADLRRGRTEIT